jgi:molecular chaperone DnaK
MTADLSPFVVGRLSPADKIAQVRILDSAGSEVGPPEPVEAEGTFAISVSLKPRVVNTLQIEGSREGRWIALSPPTLSIVHGLTLQDPPLSRTVGLALADNRVHVYFERGAPLPIRRTFTHNTVETVSPGEDFALKVPIVQGEFRASHLCRLVGVLEVPARGLKRSLPVGSPIEVTLELDRGGRLSARARLEDGLIFEQVATLIVPQLSAEALTQMVAELRPRLQKAAMEASRQLDPTAAARLGRAESLLEDAARGIHLGKGGDADATERARRQLIEVDEALASAEADAAWPALEAEVQILLANAVVLVGRTGSPAEKELLTDAQSRLRGALRTRNLSEVERLRTLIIELRHNAFIRTPDAWPHLFRTAVSHQGDMTDTRKAAALIRRGEDELRRADLPALEATTRALWELWPPDVQERRRSHGSGIR